MIFSALRFRTAVDRLKALSGWRRHGVAALLGLLATLALPPVHAIPLLWLSLPGLVWLIDSAKRPRGAFAAGWWWGFGHFSGGFYWIAHALLIDPLKYGWMIPFAVFGLAAVIAVFPALAAIAARRLAAAGVTRVLVLAAAWVFFEWCRSWVLTGFTWNLIGTVWAPVLPVAQFAAIAGTYGLSLLTILAAAMPAVLLGSSRRTDRWAVAGCLSLLALTALWGAVRIPASPMPTWPGVTLRLIQANVAQSDKWSPGLRWLNLQQHLELTASPGHDGLTAVIWPETAAPVFIEQDGEARRLLSEAVPPGGLLITGAPRGRFEKGDLQQIWNSLQALDGQGKLVATYDKAHLVPFGEYVPYSDILPIPKITAGSIDFSAGPGPRTLTLPGLPPVGPMICYEAIFPGEVAEREHHPDWLLNVTNDGWFGISAGPYQHFAASRLRAIEEGIPLVRAANTGISAVVDPYGRVIGQLALGSSGYLDTPLPLPISGMNTFAKFGNTVVFLLLFVVIGTAIGWHRLFKQG